MASVPYPRPGAPGTRAMRTFMHAFSSSSSFSTTSPRYVPSSDEVIAQSARSSAAPMRSRCAATCSRVNVACVPVRRFDSSSPSAAQTPLRCSGPSGTRTSRDVRSVGTGDRALCWTTRPGYPGRAVQHA
ncbi:hypothetical protein CPER28S_02618 [Cellulomonas persica]